MSAFESAWNVLKSDPRMQAYGSRGHPDLEGGTRNFGTIPPEVMLYALMARDAPRGSGIRPAGERSPLKRERAHDKMRRLMTSQADEGAFTPGEAAAMRMRPATPAADYRDGNLALGGYRSADSDRPGSVSRTPRPLPAPRRRKME